MNTKILYACLLKAYMQNVTGNSSVYVSGSYSRNHRSLPLHDLIFKHTNLHTKTYEYKYFENNWLDSSTKLVKNTTHGH